MSYSQISSKFCLTEDECCNGLGGICCDTSNCEECSGTVCVFKAVYLSKGSGAACGYDCECISEVCAVVCD